MKKLTELVFDNTYARLPEALYSRVKPTPISAPYLVSFNRTAAELIDLNESEACRPEFVEYFSGNQLFPGADPIATLYAGHQFGSWVTQLGDGRAILLGEVRNQKGARWDLQLKGAGQTPFSRGFDGRAVLRSTIREYLCSEAMHHLGIPTTRALCITGSDMPVHRERIETAAVLVRMAETHVRFGTFEVFAARGQYEHVKTLADYVIKEFYPELADERDKYAAFLREVVRRTARLMAQWQAVGFTHGVMNTDNMSVLGITLDYGPFGFMDEYDEAFIPNHSDYGGRYAFNQQPHIGLWNLSCFAHALLSVVSEDAAFAALDLYEADFNNSYGELMRAKLGFVEAREDDSSMLKELLDAMQASAVDYTIFFRRLAGFKQETEERDELLRDMFIDPMRFDGWAAKYRARLQAEGSVDGERAAKMNRVNPKYILRNYMAQRAITEATERRDFTEIERLLDLLRAPFDEQLERETYAAPSPDWGKRLVVSCSS
ncbi:MAG: YdiU family protein [Pyrinomonadaceae bacterium]|nr:YdiU family protein [Pyrinomonadaceae bacterium]